MTRRALIAAAATFALAATPFFAIQSEAQIFNSVKDFEAEMRVMWLTMKRNTPAHPSRALQRMAQCIAFEIINHVPEEFQNLDWEVIVFDDAQVNAGVTPEGKIYIYSGILEMADTPAKLAAVIGHEVAHLTEEHIRSRLRRASLSGLVGAAGGALTGMQSQEAALVVLQYPFQREQENEADLTGMMYMAKIGYNPAETLEVWRSMVENNERNGQRPSEFLSTHPDPEFRMRDIALNLSPALIAYNQALDAGVRPRCNL